MLQTPADEGAALAAALLDGLKSHWDGRDCVDWMARRKVRGANDNEWQGFYCEASAREVLNKAFPPAREPQRTRYGNTIFDYSLNKVWDLKAHTEWHSSSTSLCAKRASREVTLNDEVAIRDCASEQGLGFLIVSGAAMMDTSGEFLAWHRAQKAARGVVSAPSNSGKSRTRKAAFTPLSVEAFWIENASALAAAITAGRLKVTGQGRQAPKSTGASGSARRDKFSMNVRRAREGLLVASHRWNIEATGSENG